MNPVLLGALKSKTMWASVIIAVLSSLQAFFGTLPLDPTTSGLVGLFISTTIALLRVLTTQSLTEKGTTP